MSDRFHELLERHGSVGIRTLNSLYKVCQAGNQVTVQKVASTEPYPAPELGAVQTGTLLTGDRVELNARGQLVLYRQDAWVLRTSKVLSFG